MTTSIATAVLLLLWFLSAATFNFSKCNGESEVVCNEKERGALLSFKQGLTDPMKRLSSWSVQEEDCCKWTGIRCDNITGRVIELYLRNPYDSDDIEAYNTFKLGGEISPSLIELEFLNYLDLSWNDFGGTHIPSFFSSMVSLRYLNLSWAEFGGRIPPQLGNLSSLRYLDLGENQDLYVDNLHWFSSLSSLEYLNMHGVDLHREVNWLQALSMLPSLSELHLSRCHLDKMIPPLGYVNFTSLVVLGLSGNHFNCEIPNWLFNLSSSLSDLALGSNSLHGQIPSAILNLHKLNDLYLTANRLTGQIPEWLGQLKYLEFLFLGSNSFHGPIPASLGNLSSLMHLDLSDNQLNGALPKSLGLLSNLCFLGVEDNHLVGNVSEVNFAKLSKLKYLFMSSNSFFFNVNSNWVPSFQLNFLDLTSCKLGPKFPEWLKTQRNLQYLYFSKSGISDTAPDWFWKLASRIEQIDLSDNQIDGDISAVLLNSSIINLSSNCFKGRLPLLSPNVIVLNIANNSFSEPISRFLCENMKEKYKLEVLDVSNNLLSGELSQCWMYWQSLTHVNLGNNNLSGKIPYSVGSLFSLKSLHLHNNSFYGDIPSSLQNCTALGLIDLGENKFSGHIPRWMGQWTTLMALRLRSNKLNGSIPPQICKLDSLIVLDLAYNSLSGSIPRCLQNISAMATINTRDDLYFEALEAEFDYVSYMENLLLVTKGRESEYKNILKFVKIIDLSSNNLFGSIPNEISSLIGLRFLNLSRNHLMGKIPDKIGGMEVLESLDLSRNHLLGEIPQSMSNLTFLSVLNLSYNNFSGRIPSSTQLQSFDATSYIGNAELCGAPLMKNCTKEEESRGAIPVAETGEEFEMSWFYIGMGTGFAISFWGVCSVLLVKRTWRHAYFQFLDDMKDKIFVATTLKVNWFCGKIKRYHIGQ